MSLHVGGGGGTHFTRCTLAWSWVCCLSDALYSLLRWGLKERNSRFCFSQNSNLKVLKFYFEKYCYCNFNLNKFRDLEKDLFNWAKISGFVVLNTFCGISIELFHAVHWSSFHVFLIFQISLCLSQQAICPLFLECEYYSFSSVLVGVIFSQVNPDIPQRVADFISRCKITMQL